MLRALKLLIASTIVLSLLSGCCGPTRCKPRRTSTRSSGRSSPATTTTPVAPLDGPLETLFDGSADTMGVPLRRAVSINHAMTTGIVVTPPVGWMGGEALDKYYSGDLALSTRSWAAGARLEEGSSSMSDGNHNARAARVENFISLEWDPAVNGTIGRNHLPARIGRGRGTHRGAPGKLFWAQVKSWGDMYVYVTGTVMDSATTQEQTEFIACMKGIRKGL